MRIEDQVCSLKQAIKLRQLGVKQNSLFYYVNYPDGYVGKNNFLVDIERKVLIKSMKSSFYSAFTVSELGNMLPKILPHVYSDY